MLDNRPDCLEHRAVYYGVLYAFYLPTDWALVCARALLNPFMDRQLFPSHLLHLFFGGGASQPAFGLGKPGGGASRRSNRVGLGDRAAG